MNDLTVESEQLQLINAALITLHREKILQTSRFLQKNPLPCRLQGRRFFVDLYANADNEIIVQHKNFLFEVQDMQVAAFQKDEKRVHEEAKTETNLQQNDMQALHSIKTESNQRNIKQRWIAFGFDQKTTLQIDWHKDGKQTVTIKQKNGNEHRTLYCKQTSIKFTNLKRKTDNNHTNFAFTNSFNNAKRQKMSVLCPTPTHVSTDEQ